MPGRPHCRMLVFNGYLYKGIYHPKSSHKPMKIMGYVSTIREMFSHGIEGEFVWDKNPWDE